jgi:hypothetical protein
MSGEQPTVSKDPTARFLAAIDEQLGPLRQAVADLNGLWGKGVGDGRVDPRATRTLKRKVGAIQGQVRGIEKLATGEIDE